MADLLTDVLIRALADQRDVLDTEAEPFVGRITIHVDLDLNVVVRSVRVRAKACKEPCFDES